MKLLYEVSVPKKKKGIGTIVLPVGVSQVKIRAAVNVNVLNVGVISNAGINQCNSIRFPIIDGKSPNTFTAFNNGDSVGNLYVFIEELGGIPDPDYFTGGVASE